MPRAVPVPTITARLIIDTHQATSIETTVRGTAFPAPTISLAAKTLPAAPPPGRIRLREKAPIDIRTA
jgi:hypothetical protein